MCFRIKNSSQDDFYWEIALVADYLALGEIFGEFLAETLSHVKIKAN